MCRPDFFVAMYNYVAFCLVLINLFHSIFSEGPIVKISDGDIKGRESRTPEGKPFFIFQGIPFAAPPIGDLRFADPQEPAKWTYVKDCTDKNVVCYQSRSYLSEFETEDCLVLNVYTPKLLQNNTDSDLAVMVYFYGGGYYIGNMTFDAYGPDFFMDKDVVIVTVNYRVGPFGFLSTGDEVISGNFGLKDQQLALKWVQKNIGVFGGDPDKVTIFGNSAGSASVGFQILNKKNKGLFRAGIMSSGSPLGSWSFQKHPEKTAFLTAKFIDNSKSMKTSEELLEYLRSVPASDLRKASIQVLGQDAFEVKQEFNGYYYGPVLDSQLKNCALEGHIYELLQSGNFMHLPIMIGITSEESLTTIDAIDFFKHLMKKFDSNNELLVSDHFNIFDNSQKKHIGNLIHQIYVEGNSTLEENLPKGIRLLGDQMMNYAVIKHAYFASDYNDVFLYQFSYDGMMGNYSGHLDGADAVVHTEDMNYIWRRNIPSANNMDLQKFPESDLIVQKRLLTLYTNFAKYLNPTHEKIPLLQNITWPTLNSRGKNGAVYMDINSDLEIKTNLKHDTYLKWDKIFVKYAVKPLDAY
ncbi:hypothetical protein WA026_015665 [Henosepilachna vigintioctopunctata]|uniref:Carboxylic ester hydrolase n=1 Tax=Henosepilachna vigintioctopunctata TaxID=420089 RepID=A0AAW1V954_9CUCU